MRVSIGDIRLWFDVMSPGLVPDGRTMRELPALVALHGGPGFDHSSFKEVLRPFCDLVQVVMYDHRGNGRSDDGDPESWTIDRWTDDVRAFCEALDLERPIVLGWSFGGFIAQSFASRYPDDLRGLILVSTAARVGFDQFGPAFERLGGPEAKEAARRFFFEHGSEAEAEFERLCYPLYAHKPNPEYFANEEGRAVKRSAVLHHFLASEAWSMDLRPGLPRVTCPTLVINGLYDPVTPPVCADELVAALARSPVTHVVAAESAHEVPVDEPHVFEEAVRAFLAGIPA
jgi:pimeloyl-ACP methyl ester carboxylesterase